MTDNLNTVPARELFLALRTPLRGNQMADGETLKVRISNIGGKKQVEISPVMERALETEMMEDACERISATMDELGILTNRSHLEPDDFAELSVTAKKSGSDWELTFTYDMPAEDEYEMQAAA